MTSLIESGDQELRECLPLEREHHCVFTWHSTPTFAYFVKVAYYLQPVPSISTMVASGCEAPQTTHLLHRHGLLRRIRETIKDFEACRELLTLGALKSEEQGWYWKVVGGGEVNERFLHALRT